MSSEVLEGHMLVEACVVLEAGTSQEWRDILFGQNSLYDTTMERSEALGYDIADSYLVSGLSNCKLSLEELQVLRTTFTPQINEYGLFSDVNEAIRFKNEIDKLVPEHAPFSVFQMRTWFNGSGVE